MSLWRRSATGNHGDDYARAFAASFDRRAEAGQDIHGEATFLTRLLGPPARGARVLDAGCGTGRVAERLHALGYAVTGVDADPAMVQVARERTPHVTWHVADLAELDLGEPFEVVAMPGNVVPFVEGDLGRVAERLAAHLAPGGYLVCGYGLDRDHLPDEYARVVPFAVWDGACEAAGLRLVGHHAGWDAAPYDGGGYSLSVHTPA